MHVVIYMLTSKMMADVVDLFLSFFLKMHHIHHCRKIVDPLLNMEDLVHDGRLFTVSQRLWV